MHSHYRCICHVISASAGAARLQCPALIVPPMLLLSALIISTSGDNVSHFKHSHHTKLVTYVVPTDGLLAEMGAHWPKYRLGLHSRRKESLVSETNEPFAHWWLSVVETAIFFLAVRPTSCLVGDYFENSANSSAARRRFTAPRLPPCHLAVKHLLSLD